MGVKMRRSSCSPGSSACWWWQHWLMGVGREGRAGKQGRWKGKGGGRQGRGEEACCLTGMQGMVGGHYSNF